MLSRILFHPISASQIGDTVCSSGRFAVRTMSSFASKFAVPKKYQASEVNVWEQFGSLSMQYKPVNLGQGFPDFLAPEHVSKALSAVALSPNAFISQYARGYGHPRLVQAISKLYSPLVGKDLNPLTEILVTCGAYEALYCAINGHVSDGDEVILIEPFFDCYEPMVNGAGGKCVYIPLKPPSTEGIINSNDWTLDFEELENLFNSKTKAIVLNTPHNPLGKVFSREELTKIAQLCQRFDVLCISDEVYEWLVFDDCEHVRMATIPGMWDRTISIGSGGKTFSVTGYKTGWAYGPAWLIHNLRVVHQNCINSCNTPTQEAIAIALEYEMERFDQPDCYMKSLAVELTQKRNYMAKFLREIGMTPTIPQGGYFMMAEYTKLANKANMKEESDPWKDYRFAKWVTKHVKVLGIPPSAFYSQNNKRLAENYMRYCFIKKQETLEQARENLLKWSDDGLQKSEAKL